MEWIIAFGCAEILLITWRIEYLKLGPLTIWFRPRKQIEGRR
jgi:hypothetical protein